MSFSSGNVENSASIIAADVTTTMLRALRYTLEAFGYRHTGDLRCSFR